MINVLLHHAFFFFRMLNDDSHRRHQKYAQLVVITELFFKTLYLKLRMRSVSKQQLRPL